MSDASLPAIDPTSAAVAEEWNYEKSPLIGCRFDPTGRYLFAGAQDHRVVRLHLETGQFSALEGHDSWIRALGFSASGARCWTGGYDGRLIEWETEAEAPEPLRVVDAHRGWIRMLSVSPDQKLLATGGNDHAVRIWDVETAEVRHTCQGHDRHVYSVLFDKEGQTLFSGDLRGVVKRWDVESGKELATLDAKQLYSPNKGQGAEFGGVRSMAITADNSELICGGLHKGTNPFGAIQEPLVVVLNTEDGATKRIHTAQGGTRAICWSVAVHPEGFVIGGCGGGSGGLLCFWKAEEETEFHRCGLPNHVYDMDLSGDGRHVATVHYDRRVRLTQLYGG